jgi:ATP-dependent 26S proteasome regulatory subunit
MLIFSLLISKEFFPMLETLCCLLFDIRQGSVAMPVPLVANSFAPVGEQTRLNRWNLFSPRPVVYCESFLDSALREKFNKDRFRISEASRQIRSVSSSRIEWESKPGANVMQMVMAALAQFPRNQKITCIMSGADSLRFHVGDDVFLEVSLTRDGGAIMTAFTSSSSGRDSSLLAKTAVESVACDMNNNVRSYSYSWSSGNVGERIFDEHNPLGEMESMINQFFGGVHHGQQEPVQIPAEGGGRGRGSLNELESMGVQVFDPSTVPSKSGRVNWSSLAGYDKVKSQVEESVILGLKHPSLFEKIARKTRSGYGKSNKPKVVLFEGPPGTGKSSTARIIAHETNVPMIHVPLESVVSKWFGESEKQIGRIYELARNVARDQGASSVIIFIDEIDSLVSSRDIGTPHEASKRILSVMLRQIDGFNTEENQGSVRCTLICATNRKKDLDKAFLSRVDSSIHFGLPSEDCRAKILKLYARHLTDEQVRQIASITDGLSGRNLKDLCQAAERHWAAEFIRGLHDNVRDDDIDVTPPPAEVYIQAAKEKFSQQIS